MSNPSNNATVKVLENVIVLEVENILEGWPAYVINFTPEDTSPHKIILHLKNPSKSVTIDSDDGNSDPEGPPNEYTKLTTNRKACIMVPKPRNNPAPYESPEESSDDGDEISSDDEEVPPTTINAIPVHLCGVPKDTIPMKRKNKFDPNWPPRRPRAFKAISPNSSIVSYEAFMTFPAAVKHKEDTCHGPEGEKENQHAVKN
ncbi:hypothetical protein BKA82DRAFT_25884 [Pisolithus tinctorius]|uniref:Uncharacterized protein n=1 Tax=Pisolithus tinctorius Marx 270 TaxID=870435 RepID=A0A0C3NV85_PISTI|nr:hypothetical protein BKA82DRAFT_25884 [Pisolithus tinctorius]KIO04785.1 hypothetical protein M404DRAFT_25884 [Pisolithus tinctorius Marx 270]